jgi:hypothetical protein
MPKNSNSGGCILPHERVTDDSAATLTILLGGANNLQGTTNSPPRTPLPPRPGPPR